MSNTTLRGKGSVRETAMLLRNEICRGSLSCELKGSAERTHNGITSVILVFDKYYARNSSRASLSIMVTGDGNDVTVDAFGSGGGQGALFSFSWGAEENFENTVRDILEPYGFK